MVRSGETSRQAMWRDELVKTGLRAKARAILKLADLEAIPGLKHLHCSGSVADSGERVTVWASTSITCGKDRAAVICRTSSSSWQTA